MASNTRAENDMPAAGLWGIRAPQAPTAPTAPTVQRAAPVAGLLFVSGMCALIYQVAWFREFRLVFGASTAASSAVLAVFMGGLGLGNAVWGKRADRVRNPLAMYARLEFSIAATAALGPLLIHLFHGLYILSGGQLAMGFSLATAVRLAISALVLGVPTFLMGGTLPAAVRAVTPSDDRERRGAALLYGMNTLGAVAGALGSTFFALEFFGTRTTLWLACGINLCTALGALALSRFAVRRDNRTDGGRRVAKTAKAAKAKQRSAHDDARLASCPAHIIYVVSGVAGCSFFLMELVWYRMLGPILGGTTFTFGLILAVALAGIGLGGSVYALFSRRIGISLHTLAITCVLEAACIAIPFALGDRLAILAATLREGNASSFMGEVAGWTIVAAIVILPAAFVSGVQFSLLIGLLGGGDKDVGKQVGLACSWNTAGAIIGSLAGGFGLLPLLSAPGIWRAVAALLAIVGVCIFLRSWPIHKHRGLLREPSGTVPILRVPPSKMGLSRLPKRFAIATIGIGVAVLGMIAFPGPTAVWRHGGVGAGRIADKNVLADPNTLRDWEHEVRRSVLWEADGVESSVAIVGSDGLAFYVNGKCDGNAIEDVGTQIMLGLIGGALHPEPHSAIVVGLGTGETAGWLAQVPSIDRVDVVELEPAVREMARRCRDVNRDVLANPKVRLIFNDAREVLLTAAGRYDLIVTEPSNPYRSGIANLFTQEFYRAGRDRLNRGGLFVQWVQAYEIDQRTMRTVFATFKSVFPHVEVWQSKQGDLVLVGAEQQSAYSVAALRSKVAAEPFASALRCAWHTADLEGFLSHYIGGTALVDRFIADGAAATNTDDHNEIEYGFARTLGRTDWDATEVLRRQSLKIGDNRVALDGVVDWQAVARSRQWDSAVRGKQLTSNDPARIDEIEEEDDKVLERYLAKNAPGTLFAWEYLPHPAPCLTELAVVAHMYAEAGSSKAEPLIEQLRRDSPVEAQSLAGILAWRQGKLSESADLLTIAIERMRTDPWLLDHIRDKTFAAAIGVAKADPKQAPKLLQAFSEPLAAYFADDARRGTACVIAERVGPATAAQFVETFEPDVPWTKRFLTYRRQIYREAGHRLAAKADRDLQDFLR